jgi:hypothetical protein
MSEDGGEQQSGVWQFSRDGLWANATVIATSVAVAFALVRIAIAADGDADTIKAIVSTENPLTTFVDILAPVVPVLMFWVGQLGLYWLAERRLMKIRRLVLETPLEVQMGQIWPQIILSVAALVLSLFILAWTFTVFLLAIVVMHVRTELLVTTAIRKAWTELAGVTSGDDADILKKIQGLTKSLPQHRFLFDRGIVTVYALIIALDLLSPGGWKPTEVVTTPAKSYAPVMVLSQDDNQTTILNLDNASVVYLATAQITSQAICSNGHWWASPGSSVVSLLAHHPYPICPREK